MIELIKKAMFTGIGVMSLTKEKVEEIAGEFVEKGKLSEQEGQKLVQEMLQRSEDSKTQLKQQIEAAVQATLSKMDIPKKSDIDDLRNELTALKEAMNREQTP